MTATPPPPPPLWLRHVRAARTRLASIGRPTDAIDDVEQRLHEATDDRRQLAIALRELDPPGVDRALKQALRDAIRWGRDEDADPVVMSLRKRHELVHATQDRIEDLDRRIAAAVFDVETTVARLAQLPREGAAGDPDASLRALRDQAHALEAAHAELEALGH